MSNNLYAIYNWISSHAHNTGQRSFTYAITFDYSRAHNTSFKDTWLLTLITQLIILVLSMHVLLCVYYMCSCLFRYPYVCTGCSGICLYVWQFIYVSMYLYVFYVCMYYYVIIGECVKYFKKFVNLWCMTYKKANILTEYCWIFFLCSWWI